MTIVSSKEFISNQDKYFDLALNEQVFIQKGENMFVVTCSNGQHCEDVVFQPDDDFYRSITMDEFKERAREVVTAAYKKYTNERNNFAESARVS